MVEWTKLKDCLWAPPDIARRLPGVRGYLALVIAPCEAEATRAAYLLNTPTL